LPQRVAQWDAMEEEIRKRAAAANSSAAKDES